MSLTLPRTRVIFACCCALIGALAVTSPRANAYVVEASGPVIAFQAGGTHGYQLTGFAAGDFAVLEVEGRESKGLFGSTTDYALFRANVGRERTRLNFGRFGRIAVRFVPSGKVRRIPPPKRCEGRPESIRFGFFEGRIRFHGEGSYTEVRARRVRGVMDTRPRRVCHPPHRRHRHRHRHHRHRHRPPGPLLTTFTASDPKHGIAFTALRTSSDPTASLLIAISAEVKDGVFISRQALRVAPASAFTFDPHLNSATISPPAPFSGSASFQRIDAYASRWEGSLAVSFPGLPEALLTGRGFAWNLSAEHARSSGYSVSVGGFSLGRALDRVAPRFLAQGDLAFSQGSGSHSQPFADARLSWSR